MKDSFNESYNSLKEKIKENIKNGKISHVHGLAELIL
jgi:hypothetical protein